MVLDIIVDELRLVEGRFERAQRDFVKRVHRGAAQGLGTYRRRQLEYLSLVDKPTRIRLIVDFIYLS